MSHHLTLMQIHAHPDDESSKGAGANALYSARGVRCVLVCCTGGEEGEILNESFGPPDRAMTEIRRDELAEATRILGYSAVHMLGYEDSGMAGSRANENPACFARAPLRHAVGRLVKTIREERPDVIITYAEDGGYPHPDHLMVHEISLPAFEAAADPAAFPLAGSPHEVSKLYFVARSKARLVALAEAHERAGLDNPFKDWIARAAEDDSITTRVDVGEYFEARRDALLAHRTQVAPDGFWFRLPLELSREAYPFEDYTLAYTRRPVRLPESDLFTGIPG